MQILSASVMLINAKIISKNLRQVGLSKQCRPRSDCSQKEQSDQSLHCLPFTHHRLD